MLCTLGAATSEAAVRPNPRYETGEQIQVVRYEPGQMYEAHWDYFNPAQYQRQPEVIERMDLTARNRMATLFWYLNDLPAGGPARPGR
jgi:hypothetical protein